MQSTVIPEEIWDRLVTERDLEKLTSSNQPTTTTTPIDENDDDGQDDHDEAFLGNLNQIATEINVGSDVQVRVYFFSLVN